MFISHLFLQTRSYYSELKDNKEQSLVKIFLITFGTFLFFVGALAIGYILRCQPISGSCGGLGTAGIDRVCGCLETCSGAREKKSAKQKKRTR